MSKFTESRIRYPLMPSRTLPERSSRDRISEKFGKWNLGVVIRSRQSAFTWLDVMEHVKRASESNVDHETAENTEPPDHPWDDLTTLTAFDQGTSNNTRSTFRLNDVNENAANRGEISPTKSQNPQVTQTCTVLIESLIHQLCAVLETDEVRRETLFYSICKKLHELELINDTYNMMEFEELRRKYQNSFYQMFSTARGEPERNSIVPRSLVPKLSRYYEEFEEISFIAHGGFGKVYKARHRLDGIEYAIKKITLPADRIEIIQKELNEVRALAKLNHTNIVSYNAAWIEPSSYNSSVSSPNRKSHSSPKHQRNKSKSYNSLINDLFCNNGTRKQKVYRNESINHDIISKRFEELDLSDDIEKKIIEMKNKEDTEESSFDVSFRNSSNENVDQTISDTNDSYLDEESSSTSKEVCTYAPETQRVTLYIQMSLCEQTLEQWLRGKISVTPEPISRVIFQQILCGVDYMHSQKIVHHDIKPSNIFISTSGKLRIQLGDFGLACPLQVGIQHSVVGTRMYSAPEQLQGKCDPKSDIYSIGIVLIQLLTLIKTLMELCSIITSLKSGQVPEALKRHKWAQMVMQLVQEDPAKRPSTSQLLQDFSDDKDMVINGLRDVIVNLKKDNCVKDNTIQGLNEEIALLKEKVQKLSIQQTDNTIN